MKIIKIPKVTKGQHVQINRTNIRQVKNGFQVTLSAQEIAGFKVKAGVTMFIPYVDGFAPFVYIEKDKLNALLKHLYLEQLRHGKDDNN